MSFVPFHQILRPPAGEPAQRTILFVHGILGSARNWRPFARKFVEACRGWSAAILDLRHHDRSRPAPAEATLAACASDVERLERRLGRPFDAVCGHSLGAKVALLHATRARSAARSVWALDASPGTDGPRPSPIDRLLADISRAPVPGRARADVIAHLHEAGWPERVTGWMAASLERSGDGLLRWRFDPDAIRALLEDYRRVDLWPPLHADDGPRPDFVLGGSSDALAPEERARLSSLQAAGRVRVHELRGAGHWVHVDDPAGLLRLLAGSLGLDRQG